ncbi:MAG: tetratricopeptide repeat protein [Acidobacteria bacterium]|nr:tetratricopeptide repeat protein [Acidobacteriota bacterium]
MLVATLRAAPENPAKGATQDRFTKIERVSNSLDTSALLFARRSLQEGNTAAKGAEHFEIHLERGRKALDEGRIDDAQRDFTEAVLLSPDSAEARMALADAYRRMGRMDDAVRELRAALWGRENADVRVQLARLFVSRGLTNEARAELRAALRAEPAHAEARRMLDSLVAPGGGPR